ncbi:hypothetical protein AAE478_007352 [Parahypoxylon ruwenzoriense]
MQLFTSLIVALASVAMAAPNAQPGNGYEDLVRKDAGLGITLAEHSTSLPAALASLVTSAPVSEYHEWNSLLHRCLSSSLNMWEKIIGG